MAEEAYRCQSCGGALEFDVKTQKLRCPNCDTIVEIETEGKDVVEHTLNMNSIRKIKVEEKQTVTMVCSGCGAPIEIDKNSTASQCPYCGSNYVLADKQAETIEPDGVVTFKLTENDAWDVFRKWIKKRYLAPGELKHLYQHGQFSRFYVPYWTFDADGTATYTALGGRHRTVSYKDSKGNTQTRIETDWYPTSGTVRKFFDDILICAAVRNDKFLLNGIDDYDTRNDIVPYSPDYLSGFASESYSVDLETGHNQAINKMGNALRDIAASDVLRRYDEVRNVKINARFTKESFKHVLLPVYSNNYDYKGKNYNVLINGETGVIKGEYPKSIAKIIGIVVGVVAIAVAVLYFMGRGEEPDYYNEGISHNYYVSTWENNEVVDDILTENYDIEYMDSSVDYNS